LAKNQPEKQTVFVQEKLLYYFYQKFDSIPESKNWQLLLEQTHSLNDLKLLFKSKGFERAVFNIEEAQYIPEIGSYKEEFKSLRPDCLNPPTSFYCVINLN
jgi:ssDNA-specific exonuclease RecJ